MSSKINLEKFPLEVSQNILSRLSLNDLDALREENFSHVKTLFPLLKKDLFRNKTITNINELIKYINIFYPSIMEEERKDLHQSVIDGFLRAKMSKTNFINDYNANLELNVQVQPRVLYNNNIHTPIHYLYGENNSIIYPYYHGFLKYQLERRVHEEDDEDDEQESYVEKLNFVIAKFFENKPIFKLSKKFMNYDLNIYEGVLDIKYSYTNLDVEMDEILKSPISEGKLPNYINRMIQDNWQYHKATNITVFGVSIVVARINNSTLVLSQHKPVVINPSIDYTKGSSIYTTYDSKNIMDTEIPILPKNVNNTKYNVYVSKDDQYKYKELDLPISEFKNITIIREDLDTVVTVVERLFNSFFKLKMMFSIVPSVDGFKFNFVRFIIDDIGSF